MNRFREFLTDLARGDGSRKQCVLFWLLWIPSRLAAGLYWMAAQSKNWFFELGIRRPQKVAAPVISIGNLSVGGTGKSPVVRWVAQWLLDRKCSVTVLSRGYKQLDSGVNDEALEFEALVPGAKQIQNPDRVLGAQEAIRCGANALVLDDGFQHRRLARDLDIVLIDASEPTGLHRVLPAGILREPYFNLVRADAVIFTHWDRATSELQEDHLQRVRGTFPTLLQCKSRHAPSQLRDLDGQIQSLERLRGARVLAFCGLGNPSGFLTSLADFGGNVVSQILWEDHHHFDNADIARLQRSFLADSCDMLICTMKDWGKLRELNTLDLPIYALQIEIEFLEGEEELRKLLLGIIAKED